MERDLLKGKGTEDGLLALLRRRVAQLEALRDVAHSVATSATLQEVLDTAVEKLRRILNCHACAILMLNEKEGVLEPKAWRGFDEDFARSMRPPYHVGVPAWIIREKRSFLTGDAPNDPLARLCLPSPEVRSFLCVPLIVRGKVVGIIHIDSLEPNAFGEGDLRFAEALAEEVSLAVERAEMFERLRDAAVTDPLTGLFNRREFMARLREEVSRSSRYGRKFSVVMFDIDDFKAFNDTYGHLVGDEALKAIAQIVKRNSRISDIPARYGGEEFAVILPETPKRSGFAYAERIRRLVEQEARVPGAERRLTISGGVSGFPEDACDPEGLVAAADKALYEAKRLGKNRVEVAKGPGGG